jgi:ATP-dependent RNA helicase DDX1
MSTDDRDLELAVAPGGLTVQARSERAWSGGRATCGVRGEAGKFYYEATVEDEGLCRVGWATRQ